MGHYITIYRWKPENAKQVAEHWLSAAKWPAEIGKALGKCTIYKRLLSKQGNFFIVQYDVDEKNLPPLNVVANFMLSLGFTLETFSVADVDDGELLKFFYKVKMDAN